MQNRPQESAPESPAPAHGRPAPVVGKRTELARYRIPAGERVLYGQRVDGVVRVTDRPTQPGGRPYLVERELERDGNGALDALVADYLAQAQKLATVPMSVAPLPPVKSESRREVGGRTEASRLCGTIPSDTRGPTTKRVRGRRVARRLVRVDASCLCREVARLLATGASEGHREQVWCAAMPVRRIEVETK